MPLTHPKLRIGTIVPNPTKVTEMLVKRQATTTNAPTATTTVTATPTNTRVPDGYVVENGRLVPVWHSRTAVIVRWSILLGIVVLFTLFMTLGYIHAKRRIRKGQLPLAYHRWLVNRNELARIDPNYRVQQSNWGWSPYGAGYGMQNMGAPPPMYDPNRPPMYAATPDGATKVDPAQSNYAPPPGPPPAAALRPEGTGSSTLPLGSMSTGKTNDPFADPGRR